MVGINCVKTIVENVNVYLLNAFIENRKDVFIQYLMKR